MKQLLIIEDDEINCLLYQQILADSCTRIDFAYDGQQGIDKFKENSYDLILLDLGLPKIDGLRVARLIKEHEDKALVTTRTPIIVITANSFPGTKQLALDAGVDGYINKPYEITELRTQVARFLGKRRTVRA